MVATSTLRWAGEGIPCQAVLLCLVRSWQSQLDVLQVLGTAAQGGDQFKSTNELRELSPPDCCTMKPKSLCICSKPWLSTLPKPWAGPGCDSRKIRAQHYPWILSHGKECCFGGAGTSSICLTHPAGILAKALLNRGSREAPAVFYKSPAPCRVFPNRFVFLSVWEKPLPPRHLGGTRVWLCVPRAPQLFLELAGLGGCKEATLNAPWKSSSLGRAGQVLGTNGMSQRPGGLASSWSRCHHPHCSRAVAWMSLEKTLLLQKTAHLFFSGWE